jgi:hypothetical protein
MWISPEHISEGVERSSYPSEKLFTLPEFKSDIYSHISDTMIELTKKQQSENFSQEVFNHALLSVIVSEYFGSLLRIRSASLWLPGDLSRLNPQETLKLEEYRQIISKIRYLIGQDVGDISSVESLRLLQDGDEKFRIAFGWDPTNQVAKSGKSVTHILRVERKDGTIQLINLLDKYTLVTSPKSEQERNTISQIQKKRKELKESMGIEPLLNGSISYEYIVWATITTYWAIRIVKKIRYRDESWKMEEVIPNEKLEWTPDQIERTIPKVLAQAGINFDPSTGKWFRILDRAVESLRKKLPNMTAIDYFALTWERVDLDIWNTSHWKILIEQLERYSGKYRVDWADIVTIKWRTDWKKFGKTLSKAIWKYWVLGPIDILLASEVWAYANSATMISATTDLSAFYIGKKIAWTTGKFAKKIPVIWKYIGPLIESGGWAMATWVAATIGKNKVWDIWLDGNVSKWQYLHTNWVGSLYTDGQSTILHSVTGLGLPEVWDQANSTLPDTETPPDIWVPRGSVSIGKRHLFEIPEVNFFQGRIDYATDPGDWMRGGRFRTIDDWNRQIGGYFDSNGNYIEWHMHITAMRIIRWIIEKYHRWEYPFTEKEIAWNINPPISYETTKEQLLEITLKESLSGWNEPDKWFLDIKWLVVQTVLRESRSWRWSQSYDYIGQVVKMQTSKMRIDEFFITSYMPTLIAFHEYEIGEFKKELYKHIKPEEQKFIEKILGKMIGNKTVFQPW